MEQRDRKFTTYPNRLFCRLDGLTPEERERQRWQNSSRLGLLNAETIPVFEEAVQTAARFIGSNSAGGTTEGFPTPICFIGIQVRDELQLKSALGLSQVGLRNELALLRKLPRSESFCQYVIDASSPLIICNVAENSVYARSILFQHYGIRAYIGIPLVDRSGECVGTIAVMDSVPREFSDRDLDFLTLTARWCMSESENLAMAKQGTARLAAPFEGTHLALPAPQRSLEGVTRLSSSNGQRDAISPNLLKVRLLVGLIEDLRNPLTSAIGMARVLEREIYGPLTDKQKEYIDIIHTSGQELLSRVEEMLGLDVLDPDSESLQLSSVDVEMLCQQSLNPLQSLAEQHQQILQLSVEPGNRIWLLDKEKLRQALYFLGYSLIQAAAAGSEIHVHISRKIEDPVSLLPSLNISLWAAHPCWSAMEQPIPIPPENGRAPDTQGLLIETLQTRKRDRKAAEEGGRETLGLLLSYRLMEMHGGKIAIETSREGGYRYVFKIPQLEGAERVALNY
ncbi:MAG: GAF domain-containing sensor histidine kinase [Cyanobacteria bacterium SBLK]|nr:GAF domain-containing sensor histidine kinase [Cyanobacteria bacterium SBLK]